MLPKPKLRRQNSVTATPSCLQNLSFYFTEYCDNTSIHGLKFLGERKRSFLERIFWAIFLSLSLYFCVVFIKSIYRKWENSPVIVTFATSQTPIWKIPFPAVTICPEVKTKRSNYDFTYHMLNRLAGNITDEEMVNYDHMSLVCPTLLGIFVNKDGPMITNETSIEFLKEVAPDFNDMLMFVKWKGAVYKKFLERESDMFVPILTNAGICHTFNLLDFDEIFTNDVKIYKYFGALNKTDSHWTIDKGYDKNADMETFPRRTLIAGSTGGLDILIRTNISDIDVLCGDSLHGYKVILHNPAEVPKSDDYFRVPMDHDVVAAVKPNMMTASSELLDYKPRDRQCYFTGEKALRFFKIYNQRNCLLECLTNFTLQYCECVAFFMPRSEDMPICGTASHSCILEAKALYLSKEVADKIKEDSRSRTSKKKKRSKVLEEHDKDKCNCLPSCNSLTFEVETSLCDWDWRQALNYVNPYNQSLKMHVSRLRVFFKDMQFITSERNQLYGQTDFWANCGGLLGLFTGFSFISLVEILYFATLRFACNVRKFGHNYWSGADKLLETRN